jgi:glyoxylase-like metal-dependent hydrolase (beta-lactamase superfamily II)
MSDQPVFLPMNTTDDGVYQVYAMCFGKRPTKASDIFMVRDPHEGPMPMHYYIWIIRNAHRVVLVDTGFGERAATARGRVRDVDPVEGLRRLGIDPETIGDVVISHLHYDHAGNIDGFPNARFHIQDAEMNFVTGRHICEPKVRTAFEVEDVVALVRRNYAERLSFHDGDDDLLPGITLHALPGHSACVQAVRVMTERGSVVLASDAVHFYANLLRRSPFWLTINLTETLESYTKVLKVAGGIDRIIPGHDPKVQQLYPTRIINGVELSALHEEPAFHDPEALARVDNFA